MAKNRAAKASTSDPMKTVADALDKAYKAAKGGKADATAAAGRALPAASRFLSRLVYTTSYTLSYGIVFPMVMLAKSIPQENSVVKGMKDGAHDASERVERLKLRREKPTAAPAALPSKSGTTRKRRSTG